MQACNASESLFGKTAAVVVAANFSVRVRTNRSQTNTATSAVSKNTSARPCLRDSATRLPALTDTAGSSQLANGDRIIQKA